MVIWVIGLSGSGKTTLASEVVNIIRNRGRKIIFLDGDEVRNLFGNDLGHELRDREKNAERICSLCAFFDKQNIDVICAILSMFPSSQEWCRRNLKNYFEVFIDTPIKTLISRDPKGIYQKFFMGKIKDVAGLDIDFPKPSKSDLVIENTETVEEFLNYAPLIADKICGEQH